MIRRMLGQLARAIAAHAVGHMDRPRVIHSRDGESPYLSRWYITKRPTMPNGTQPFDKYGDPRDGIVWPDERFGLYMHRFHRGDDDVELHSHPWDWALSFVFAGGYVEERRVDGVFGEHRVITRTVLPFSFNFIRSNDFHRVELLEDDAWSLFLVGPKTKSWGFWNRATNAFTPWKEFIAQASLSAPFKRATFGDKSVVTERQLEQRGMIATVKVNQPS